MSGIRAPWPSGSTCHDQLSSFSPSLLLLLRLSSRRRSCRFCFFLLFALVLKKIPEPMRKKIEQKSFLFGSSFFFFFDGLFSVGSKNGATINCWAQWETSVLLVGWLPLLVPFLSPFFRASSEHISFPICKSQPSAPAVCLPPVDTQRRDARQGPRPRRRPGRLGQRRLPRFWILQQRRQRSQELGKSLP